MIPSSIEESLGALAPRIREAAEEIERQRRLPIELVRAMAPVGLFRLGVPASLGGPEVEPAGMVEVIESVAQMDGAAGWCVMIGSTTSLLSAYLPFATARTIFGSPEQIGGGVFAPLGKAVVVDGGFRVTGRWPFASGCQHCDWMMGGCVVMEDGKPRRLADDSLDTRMMLFPSRDLEIHDTWDVSGLRGSGSHDFSVADVFVADDLSTSFSAEQLRHEGVLYKFPVFGLLALGIAGVCLGIARHAIDELTDLACAKVPSGSRRKLAERPILQLQVAQAEALLRSARAFLFDTIRDVTKQSHVSSIGAESRALLRLAATHATASAAQAVDLMYTAGGGTAVYAQSPLQRCFRDVHVATQHFMVAQPTWELIGRVLLGLETDARSL